MNQPMTIDGIGTFQIDDYLYSPGTKYKVLGVIRNARLSDFTEPEDLFVLCAHHNNEIRVFTKTQMSIAELLPATEHAERQRRLFQHQRELRLKFTVASLDSMETSELKTIQDAITAIRATRQATEGPLP
jgi:hypothetical protein